MAANSPAYPARRKTGSAAKKRAAVLATSVRTTAANTAQPASGMYKQAAPRPSRTASGSGVNIRKAHEKRSTGLGRRHASHATKAHTATTPSELKVSHDRNRSPIAVFSNTNTRWRDNSGR